MDIVSDCLTCDCNNIISHIDGDPMYSALFWELSDLM